MRRAAEQPVEPQSHLCHSDNEKFRSDLNRPEICKMSERALKTLRKFSDFQAEYEGSICFDCAEIRVSQPANVLFQ